jgi:uncharacterized membrane protein YhaH (DUF805 family)
MENFKKYFEFGGTISGLNYFLRQLLTSLVAFIGGFTLGYGIGSDSIGLITLGLVILSPAVCMSFATIYKRCEALFPGLAASYTLGIIILQVLNQFVDKTNSMLSGLASIVLLVIGLYLIFKNSDITEHNG